MAETRNPSTGLLEGVEHLAAAAGAATSADPTLETAVVHELPTRPAQLPPGRTMVIVVEGKTVAVRTFSRSGGTERDSAASAASAARLLTVAGAVLGEDPGHTNAPSGLTEDEIAVLREGGLVVEDAPAAAEDPVAQSIAAYANLIATSLDVEHTARRLGVKPSRIRQRLGGPGPTLYGFKVGGSWRVPTMQLGRRGTLPGLEAVVPALPRDLHALEFVGWFTQPQPDLEEDDDTSPLSPRDWLSLGRPPEIVAALARELAHAP